MAYRQSGAGCDPVRRWAFPRGRAVQGIYSSTLFLTPPSFTTKFSLTLIHFPAQTHTFMLSCSIPCAISLFLSLIFSCFIYIYVIRSKGRSAITGYMLQGLAFYAAYRFTYTVFILVLNQ
jgi:hypothetical protein